MYIREDWEDAEDFKPQGGGVAEVIGVVLPNSSVTDMTSLAASWPYRGGLGGIAGLVPLGSS